MLKRQKDFGWIGCAMLFLSINAAELRRVSVLSGVFLVESST